MLGWPCPFLALHLTEESWPKVLKGEQAAMSQALKNCSPTLTSTLIPHHGHGRTGPDGIGVGKLVLPLTSAWVSRNWPIQLAKVHIQGLGLARPNTYPIYVLLGHMKGLILQNAMDRISMTSAAAGYLRQSSDNVLPETRGPEPDQWLNAMNICK